MMLIVIPARFASTRFPGKPLVDIQGKSMIQRVYEQARACKRAGKVIVATDDERIFQHVQAFGGLVEMTKATHPSGTDRCAEVAKRHPEATFVINVQGDEPFIHPEQIDFLAETLLHSKAPIATLARRIDNTEALQNPNIVKVALAQNGHALYFSRHAIPFLRNNTPPGEWLAQQPYYQHIGLYGFRRSTLLKLARLSPSPLEQSESLEQLRWLENGYRIAVGITALSSIGIDTPEDLERVG